ncbi:MAG: hypothetical protein LRY26_01590 [Bacilli bacterium]|nr:hypothetical protein [Bacilli bacterium]
MASSVIHLCIAKEVNKEIKKDESKILIGSIAPDISKMIGESKFISHFQEEESDVPNIEWFLKKYKHYLNDDFVLGYYIHLYTDYLWFKYFMTEIINENKNVIKKLDGTLVKCNEEMFSKYIYNDYTNLNVQLIDEYDLNLKVFYNELPEMNKIIEEIPMDRLNVILDKAGIIIANSKETKALTIDITDIKKIC